MRYQMFGYSFVLAAAAVVGCGGDDGGKVIVPDAKVYQDAPVDVPHVCALGTMNTLGSLSLGTTAAPASGDFFIVPTQGANMGKTVFLLGGKLNNDAASDILAFEVVKPTGGFQTNSAYPFNADPNAAYVAASYILGDYNSTAMTLGTFYYASSGSATFTMIGEADGNAIVGSVAATMYREVDDAGANVPGGCTASLGGLSFNLKQMAAPRVEQPMWTDPRVHISPAEWAAVTARIEAFKATQQ
ncbi:MAG TPA: hypothetical protein VIV40_39300 [Kofleriaceae bacterium]